MFLLSLLPATYQKISHHGYNFALNEKHDPGFLIVSPAYPDLCFTVFDTDIEYRHVYSINLAPASLETLEYQIFHSYYRVIDRGVWFEWVRKLEKPRALLTKEENDTGIERIQVIANGLEIHGTKALIESDELFKIVRLKGTNLFNIMSNGKCLTVADYKNEARDAIPMFFRMCNESIEQEFTFVSILKAVCLMHSETLCAWDDEMALEIAEATVSKRIKMMENGMVS
ncbi:hypothetical protein COBT_002117 [Conglomerata obtusa]